MHDFHAAFMHDFHAAFHAAFHASIHIHISFFIYTDEVEVPEGMKNNEVGIPRTVYRIFEDFSRQVEWCTKSSFPTILALKK